MMRRGTAYLYLLIMVIPLQCDPETQYKVLSFFFDGVPLPPSMQPAVVDTMQSAGNDSIPQLAEALTPKKPSAPTVYLHPPYKERKCDVCHESEGGQRLLEARPDLVCRKCHEQFNQEYRFVHGPVAVGQCLRCHNPHSTKNPYLLIRKGEEVCTYCHEEINRWSISAHASEGPLNCLQCHSPHYSNENRFFLVSENGGQ